MQAPPLVRRLGRIDYLAALDAMRAFTTTRDADTPDEIWLCEHSPVYTLGVGAREGQWRDDTGIPVVRSDRGGQITYHGPGQVVAYALVDLRRLGIFVKEYVFRLEHAALRVLEQAGITGHRVPGAPGVYVRPSAPGDHAVWRPPDAGVDRFEGLAKVAALGVKISRHCTYHGVALNVDMDLAPFGRIDPCGYAGLATTDLRRLGASLSWDRAADLLSAQLVAQLSQR